MQTDEDTRPSYDKNGTLGWYEARHFAKIFDEAMPYRFTTEDIATYLPHLDVDGARCLTIAGSGDQVVDLLAAGADEVVIFDRMKNALAAADLKMTVLRDWVGDLEGFVRSFGSEWPRSVETRRRTFGMAEGEDMSKNMAVLETEKIRPPFFKSGQARGLAGYLESDERFQTARRAVDVALGHARVKAFQADVRDLGHVPNLGTFDVIVLSNVVSTIVHTTRRPPWTCHGLDRRLLSDRDDLDRVRAVHADTAWRAARLLRPGGAMMADFLYGVDGYGYPYGVEGLFDGPAVTHDGLPMTTEEVEAENAELRADLDRLAGYRRRRQDEWTPPAGFSVEEVTTWPSS